LATKFHPVYSFAESAIVAATAVAINIATDTNNVLAWAAVPLLVALPPTLDVLATRHAAQHDQEPVEWNRGDTIRRATAPLLIPAITALVICLGLIVYAVQRPADTCRSPQSADLRVPAPADNDNDLNYVVTVNCTSPADAHLIVIAQVRYRPTQQPLYYLSWDMSGEVPAQHETRTTKRPFPGREPGEQIIYYVIRVDDSGYAQLLAGRNKENYVTTLPDGFLVVSNKVSI
jgi:hypothetical protein